MRIFAAICGYQLTFPIPILRSHASVSARHILVSWGDVCIPQRTRAPVRVYTACTFQVREFSVFSISPILRLLAGCHRQQPPKTVLLPAYRLRPPVSGKLSFWFQVSESDWLLGGLGSNVFTRGQSSACEASQQVEVAWRLRYENLTHVYQFTFIVSLDLSSGSRWPAYNNHARPHEDVTSWDQ